MRWITEWKKWRADLGACSALFLFANLPFTSVNPIGVSSPLSIPLRWLPLDFWLPSWPHDETAVEAPLVRPCRDLGEQKPCVSLDPESLLRNSYSIGNFDFVLLSTVRSTFRSSISLSIKSFFAPMDVLLLMVCRVSEDDGTILCFGQHIIRAPHAGAIPDQALPGSLLTSSRKHEIRSRDIWLRLTASITSSNMPYCPYLDTSSFLLARGISFTTLQHHMWPQDSVCSLSRESTATHPPATSERQARPNRVGADFRKMQQNARNPSRRCDSK